MPYSLNRSMTLVIKSMASALNQQLPLPLSLARQSHSVSVSISHVT